ncbi:MAG: hypothetical protein J4431_00395, partial [Candidatus Aenigmarchaeota archaeon]|nr:hypothetical protein [Candidatus Aenigmarchaeota archaeon]
MGSETALPSLMPIRCRQGGFLKASQGKEFVRGSSSFARLKVHVTFKVKYCHRIFGWDTLREECSRLFYEVAEKQGVVIECEISRVPFIIEFREVAFHDGYVYSDR